MIEAVLLIAGVIVLSLTLSVIIIDVIRMYIGDSDEES